MLSDSSPNPEEEVVEIQKAAEADLSKVGSGVRWTTISTFVLRLSGFLMGVLAARLIAPDQFGAFAVSLTVYTFLLTIADLGVTQAIVREVQRTAAIGSTVQAINLYFSALITIGMFIAAPHLASLLGAPQATDALRVLSLTILASGFGSVPAMILTRDYRQKERFYSDGLNFVVGSVALVVLALTGHGVMALAWSRLIGQVASGVLLNLMVTERYAPRIVRAELGPLLRFSAPLAGAAMLVICVSNVDSVTIARTLGAEKLGWYDLAFNMAGWPINIFSQILLNITVTTLARVQHDQEQLRTHMASALTAVAAAAFPTAAMLMALSGPVISSVYGARWAPAAEVLVPLGLLTAFRVVQTLQSDLLVALGLTRHLLRIHLAWLLALIPAMILLVRHFGIVGGGYAHVLVAALVCLPAYGVLIGRRVHLSVGWTVRLTIVPALGAVLAGVVAYVVSRQFDNSWVALLAGGVSGSAAYVAAVGLWWRRRWRAIRELYS